MIAGINLSQDDGVGDVFYINMHTILQLGQVKRRSLAFLILWYAFHVFKNEAPQTWCRYT